MSSEPRKRKKHPRGLFQRGGIWWIDYTDNSGRRIRESTKTINKTLAERALAVRKAEVAQNKFSIQKIKPAPDFDKFAKVYLEEYAKTNKRSWKQDEIALRVHLIPCFGRKCLDKIAEIDVLRYKRHREQQISKFPRNLHLQTKEMSFVSINRELALLKKMFNQAIRWGKTNHNPVSRNVKMYKEQERIRYLSPQEESDLLATCPPVLKNVVLFALNTGLRRSEVASLNWQDVDIARGFVTIRASYSKNSETRMVFINKTVTDLLKKLEKTDKKHNMVFCNTKGEPFLSSGIATGFKRAVKNSGLKNLTFHDLRHTFASRLVMQGVNLYTVQRLLGHKSYKMTQRYAHLSDSHLQNAVRILD